MLLKKVGKGRVEGGGFGIRGIREGFLFLCSFEGIWSLKFPSCTTYGPQRRGRWMGLRECLEGGVKMLIGGRWGTCQESEANLGRVHSGGSDAFSGDQEETMKRLLTGE